MRQFLIRHRWLLIVLITMLIAALPILTYPLGRDQAMYANIGRSILAGGTPYVDMWDIKPPPIYYIYAAGIAIFGTHWGALRAIDLATVPVGAIGLYLIGLHLAQRRVGVWAALLYSIFYFTETFASLTQNDSLVGILMIWAALATLKASATHGRRAAVWALLAGALCGLILWFKHYLAFFVLALVIFRLWRWLMPMLQARANHDLTPQPPLTHDLTPQPPLTHDLTPQPPLHTWRGGGVFLEIVAFCLGGFMTGGSLLAYFWSNGVIAEMLIVAQGTAAYNALGYDATEFLVAMQNYVYFRWRHWGALVLIFLVGAAISLMRRFSKSTNQDFSTQHSALSTQHLALSTQHSTLSTQYLALSTQHVLLYLWLLAGFAFMVIQAKGFDTHWLPMLPPLVMLAAMSLDNTLQGLAQGIAHWRGKAYFLYGLHSLVVVGLGLILLSNTWLRALPYLTGQETLAEYYVRFPEGGDLNPAYSVQMVEYLRPRVAPGDTLYIWGFRPEVAYMGGWRPATRFQAQFPLVVSWFPVAWQQENVDTLWAAMPPYVLVLQGDYMPWVTGSNEDSHQLLVRYTELSNWLSANYERETLIGSFIVWKKKLS